MTRMNARGGALEVAFDHELLVISVGGGCPSAWAVIALGGIRV